MWPLLVLAAHVCVVACAAVEDGSGLIDRREFRQALLLLGMQLDAHSADELFDSLDDDGSGQLEYRELRKKLRKTAERSKKKRPPRLTEVTLEAEVSEERKERCAQHEARLLLRAAEVAARQRLVKVQRQLLRASSEGAVLEAAAQKRQAAAQKKEEQLRRVGKHLNVKLASVPPATAEELQAIAEALCHRLASLPDASAKYGRAQHDWFSMFRHMDADESGRISLAELRRGASAATKSGRASPQPHRLVAVPGGGAPRRRWPLLGLPLRRQWEGGYARLALRLTLRSGGGGMRAGLRGVLRLTKDEMPEARIQSLWRALDADQSGFVSAGEFGRFMRKGEAEGQAARVRGARQSLQRRLVEEKKEQHAAYAQLVGRDLNSRWEGVAAASEAEADELSELFNARLQSNPATRSLNWFQFFTHIVGGPPRACAHHIRNGLCDPELCC